MMGADGRESQLTCQSTDAEGSRLYTHSQYTLPRAAVKVDTTTSPTPLTKPGWPRAAKRLACKVYACGRAGVSMWACKCVSVECVRVHACGGGRGCVRQYTKTAERYCVTQLTTSTRAAAGSRRCGAATPAQASSRLRFQISPNQPPAPDSEPLASEAAVSVAVISEAAASEPEWERGSTRWKSLEPSGTVTQQQSRQDGAPPATRDPPPACARSPRTPYLATTPALVSSRQHCGVAPGPSASCAAAVVVAAQSVTRCVGCPSPSTRFVIGFEFVSP